MNKFKKRVISTLSLKPRAGKNQVVCKLPWKSNYESLDDITEIKQLTQTHKNTHVSIDEQMQIMAEGSPLTRIFNSHLAYMDIDEFNKTALKEGIGYCVNGTFKRLQPVHNGSFEKSSGIVSVVLEHIGDVEEAIALFTSKPYILFCYKNYLRFCRIKFTFPRYLLS